MSDLLERVWTAIDDELFSGKHTDNPWMTAEHERDIAAAAIKAVADWLETQRRDVPAHGWEFANALRFEAQTEMTDE